MSADAPNRIVCPTCGRSGPYRPELAGKRLKCKCGGIIPVPAAAPVEAEEPLRPEPLPESVAEEDPDAIYDVREPAPDPQEVYKAPPPPRPALQKASPQPASAAAPTPDVFPTFSKRRSDAADRENEKKNFVRLALILGAFAVVVVGAIVGIKMLGGHRNTGPQLGEDADIEAKINDEYNKEIHDWFNEDHSRMMGPWSESQALSMAGRWQQEGAKKVLAFGSRMSTIAVIELPDDPAQRKQIFDWQADWHREHFEKVWTDVGQKYLMIRLGI